MGLGAIALKTLLAESAQAEEVSAPTDPLAPRQPQFPAKAKNVIFLFMAGAPSHLELFDNKPVLRKFDGTLPPPELAEGIPGSVHQSEFQAAGAEVQVRDATGNRARNSLRCCRTSRRWWTISPS